MKRRLHFYATVRAYSEVEGVSQRDAFRYINDHHPTLCNSFDTIRAFEVWISRHRDETRALNAENGPIPTVFEDALPDMRPSVTEDEALSAGLHVFSITPAKRIELIVARLKRRLQSDPRALDQILADYARLIAE